VVSETEDRDMDELLDELRSAIAAAGGLGDDDRAHLDELVRRIEVEADENEDDDPNLVESLEESLARFETEHLGLVQTINRIANALSAGGI
jgi:ribosomal protein L12E/L44/L45/RPP1/RPP2